MENIFFKIIIYAHHVINKMDILYLNIHAKNAMLDAKLVQDHFKMNVQAAKANTFFIKL